MGEAGAGEAGREGEGRGGGVAAGLATRSQTGLKRTVTLALNVGRAVLLRRGTDAHVAALPRQPTFRTAR